MLMKRVISFFLLSFFLLIIFNMVFVFAESDSENESRKNLGNSPEASLNNDSNNLEDVENENKDSSRKIERKEKRNNRIIKAELREKFEARLDNSEDRIRKIEDFKVKIKEKREIKIENRIIRISELDDERKEIIAGKINAKTGLNLTTEDINNRTILRAYLSNGKAAHIRYLPDEASIIALNRLKAKCEETGCDVELREIKGDGETKRLAYEIEGRRDSRFLFIFKNKMKVRAEVDAETGEIISVRKPLWAFLASEEEASNNEIDDSVGVIDEKNLG
jgi:uncharacterized membrane protein YkoI